MQTVAPTPSARGPHLPGLDGIRGIAITLVLLFHSFQTSQLVHDVTKYPTDELLYRVAMTGWTGVDLFFVLSGFLITGILYSAKGGANFFKAFYFRRLVRIFPLYYAVLAFYLLVLPALFPQDARLQTGAHNQLWSWTYLSNVAVVLKGWGIPSPYLNHFWTLAVEEQYYLVWPLIVYGCSRRALMRICAAAIALALALRCLVFLLDYEPVAAYVLTPMRLDTLAVGSWLALAVRDPAMLHRLARWVRPATIALGAGVAALFVWRSGLNAYDPVTGTVGLSLIAGFSGCVVFTGATAEPSTRIGRVLTTPLLRTLGKYSYGLYVFHWPVILFLGERGLLARLIPPGPGMVFYKQVMFAALAMGISLCVAFVSWQLYERQFLKLKRRVEYRPELTAAVERTPG